MRKQMVNMSMLAMSLPATAAIAQDAPDYGFEFVTIGDPGNRDTLDGEVAFSTGVHIGAVDYAYRMMTMEVTVGQYFEFAQVYHPYYTANTGNTFGHGEFVGSNIQLVSGNMSIRNGVSPDLAMNAGWEYATRYINWLHHGKVNEEWAFESGVYDTSTFTENSDGTYNHQATHHPSARFWLPTRNEWTKAAYWDPDKDSGLGGYWRFQNGSDNEPLPETERNAGAGDEFPLDVGSFPEVMSPWGLLDMAGGVQEWTEAIHREWPQIRFYLGTGFSWSYGDPFSLDQVGWSSTSSVFSSLGIGFRLASTMYHPADLNQDGHVNFFDISLFIQLFIAGDEHADFRLDGELDLDDARVFLGLMGF